MVPGGVDDDAPLVGGWLVSVPHAEQPELAVVGDFVDILDAADHIAASRDHLHRHAAGELGSVSGRRQDAVAFVRMIGHHGNRAARAAQYRVWVLLVLPPWPPERCCVPIVRIDGLRNTVALVVAG